jgi:hypothetical protein
VDPPPATRRHRGEGLQSKALASGSSEVNNSAHLPVSEDEKGKAGDQACKDQGLPPSARSPKMVPPPRTNGALRTSGMCLVPLMRFDRRRWTSPS